MTNTFQNTVKITHKLYIHYTRSIQHGVLLLSNLYVFLAWCLVKHTDKFPFTINQSIIQSQYSSRHLTTNVYMVSREVFEPSAQKMELSG